jgi:general secretion pathway protein J
MTRLSVLRDDAGFTLVELLVSMTLLAFLTLALGGALHFGARAWERSEARAPDDIRLVQQFLRHALEQAYPVYENGARPHVVFAGSERRLAFIAPFPATATIGRDALTLALNSDGDRVQLVVSSAGGVREALLHNLAGASFAYFGPDRSNGPSSWHGEWANRQMLPAAIRVRVRFPHGDARRWPDLIVAPPIAVDSACEYDDATRACRGRR